MGPGNISSMDDDRKEETPEEPGVDGFEKIKDFGNTDVKTKKGMQSKSITIMP